MRNHVSFVMSWLVAGIATGISIAADNPKSDAQLQKITEAHEETVKRAGDLQGYKPTPEEVAANAIRVEKHVTMSEKTGKIKMISYRTFRGDRRIKEYIERDTNNDGELDLFMEMFRVGSDVCVALTRSTREPGRGSSVHVNGMPHVGAEFMDKDSDGKFDELLLMQDDGRFIEYYRRDPSGLMQPVSSEEYLKTMRGAEAIAPFTGAVIGAIKDKGQEATPNRVRGSD